MRDLNYQLRQHCRRNRDGSFSTQAKRERMLTRIANQLHALGYRGMHAQSLRPKHVAALVARWRQEGLSPGTQKNRMAALLWWAEKVKRQNGIARSNDHCGVPKRIFVTGVSKAKTLSAAELERIRD